VQFVITFRQHVLSHQALFVPKRPGVQILSSIKSLQHHFSFSLQPFLVILCYVRERKRAARGEEEGFFDVDFLVWWGDH
jgi:hypothetical protein